MLLGRYIERNARCFPGHPAILFEGRAISHAQFAARVHRFANALHERGVLPGERIAVLAQNCPEYCEAYAAAELAGFIVTGLNYRLSATEQAAILRDCEPGVLLFEAHYAPRAAELRAALPPGVRLICIGAGPQWAERYDEILASAPETAPRTRPAAGDTCYLIYTSGTTGGAKGVMLSQGGLAEMARAVSAAECADPSDRMLIVMPFYHIGGRIQQLAWTLVGATIVLHRAFNASEVLRSIEQHKVTCALLAPVMIQNLLEHGLEKHDVSSLRTIVYASAPMSVVLLKRAIARFGNIFMQVYGMTEHGIATVLYKHQHRVDGSPKDLARLASAGVPFVEAEIRVVRADGSDCAIGETGEIWMRSATLMQGYWRNPAATAEAISGGWMRSGDLGYFDDEAFLFIVDRKKDMIVSGGENIYSREVEEALLAHPAVAEAAVIGVPDEKWGESVMAFVALRSGAAATEAELIEHCRGRIAGYKKPRSVKLLDALPRISSTNKIDKKKLRDPYWAGRERRNV